MCVNSANGQPGEKLLRDDRLQVVTVLVLFGLGTTCSLLGGLGLVEFLLIRANWSSLAT